MTEQHAQVVYNDVAEGSNLQGQLFEGKKFWIAQRCPSRNRYVDQIRSNGGQIVPLEKQADYLIADHARKDVPAGSLSYRFIEQSIRDGELADQDEHLAGPPRGAPRDVGSSRPTRTGRIAYTQEDDRQLYKWVKDYERKGGAVQGNEIYKQLEQVNPRHTWQSWRDRYVKNLQHRPASALPPANAPPSPPSDQPTEQPATNGPESKTKEAKKEKMKKDSTAVNGSRLRKNSPAPAVEHETTTKPKAKHVKFSKEDYEELYANAGHILSVPAGQYLEAWESWATGTPQTAEEWQKYFKDTVWPRWKEDPQSRKEEIQKKVHAKHEAERPQSSGDGHHGDEGGVERVGTSSSPLPNLIAREAKGKQRAQSPGPAIVSPEPRRGKFHDQPTVLDGASEIERSETPNALLNRLIMSLVKERGGLKPINAYKFFAEEQKPALREEQPGLVYVEQHRVLLARWNALSADDQEKYRAMEVADHKRWELETGRSSEERRDRTEDVIYALAKMHEDSKKRRRHPDEEAEEVQAVATSPRAKKARQESPLFVSELSTDEEVQQTLDEETLIEPQSGEEAAEGTWKPGFEGDLDGTAPSHVETPKKRVGPKVIYLSSDSEEEEQTETDLDDFIQQELHSSHEADAIPPTQPEIQDSIFQDSVFGPDIDVEAAIDDVAGSEPPSATPTTRAAPHKKESAFDTQAILSSPSQALDLDLALPEGGFTQRTSQRSPSPTLPQQASSPNLVLESESVGTSQSIQEFRRVRSLSPPFDISAAANLPKPDEGTDEEDEDTQSTDPDPDNDPPLSTAAAVNAFFAQQQEEGYSRNRIFWALQRTSLRPGLAELVLEGGDELPDERGVWSEREDEWLGGGDARKLARLEAKHTDYGWGGCTERRIFLEKAGRMGGAR